MPDRVLQQPTLTDQTIYLEFQVPGEPVPWQVWTRRSKPSITFLVMQAWQTQIQAAAKQTIMFDSQPPFGMSRQAWVNCFPIRGRIRLTMRFYRSIPANAPTEGKDRITWVAEHIIMPPDLRNYEKACEDALQGIVYLKDAQVIADGNSYKAYSAGAPHTDIIVEGLR